MADEADRPFGGHFKIPDDFQQFCSLHAAFSVEGESSAACQEFLQRLVTLHPPARDPALVADIMHVCAPPLACARPCHRDQNQPSYASWLARIGATRVVVLRTLTLPPHYWRVVNKANVCLCARYT